MKKVYIISSSLRKGSNSEILAHEFEKGAISSNNEVKFFTFKDFNLQFCKGCLACVKTGHCVINDDVKNVINDISSSDVICFATPVYYYGMSGQLKTLLDRLNPLYSKENKFKEIYLLGACADVSTNAFDKTIVSLSGWIECFNGVKLVDTLLATDTNEPLSVSDKFKEKAYKLGNNIK